MKPGLKTIGVRLLQEMLRAEGASLDSIDPYERYLFVWPALKCHGCACEETFGLDQNHQAKIQRSFLQIAAAQAKAQGWKITEPNETVMTSEAYCPECAFQQL